MKTSTIFLSLLFSLVLVTGCKTNGESKDAEKTVAAQPAADKGTADHSATLPKPGNVNVSQFAKMMNDVPDLQVLDVRTPEEVAQGTIKGAKVINIFDADFAERAIKELDKSKPLAVYCKMGGRSSRAINVLSQHGFTKTYNLSGGITQWRAEGKETVK